MLRSHINHLFHNICFAIAATFLVSCHTKKTSEPAIKIPEGKTYVKGEWKKFRLGDMDGDGKRDFAEVYTPPYYETPFEGRPGKFEFAGCVNDSCYNRIRFSAGYPEIWHGNSLWGGIEPLGDLDEDGINEFMFHTGWWIGSHVGVYVYSFDKEKKSWVVLAKNWMYEKDTYSDRVTKIDKTEFKFSIEYLDTMEQMTMTKDTLIKIRK